MPWSRRPRSMSATSSPSSSSLRRSGRRNGSSTSPAFRSCRRKPRSAPHSLREAGRARAERRGPTRPVHEDPGQGFQGAGRTDGPGGVRGEPPRASARPTPARDQGCTRRRPARPERATARARGGPSVRLPSPRPFKAGSTPTSSGASRRRGRSTSPAGFSSRSRARSSLSTAPIWIGWPRTSARRAGRTAAACRSSSPRPSAPMASPRGSRAAAGRAIPSPAGTRPTSRTSRPSSSRRASAGSRSISAPP